MILSLSALRRCSTAALLLLALAVPGRAWAQASGAMPTCMSLLTSEEVAKAIEPGFQDMGSTVRDAGATECAWMLRGGTSGFKTVSLEFYDHVAIKASPTAATPDGFFEMVVSGAEGVASGKREVLPGIGVKAAFVPTDPQGLVVVQRADGVARIVGNNLTKAQITAIARAVAAP